MEKVMHTMTKKWIADGKVCIDESMIKNLGRAIDFKQYMTMKPITHGIKAFQLTCKSHTLGWEIYLEKGYKLDSTAEAMVLRLIMNANLTQESGRILYTDRWYTSISFAKTLFSKFDWLFVGKTTPTLRRKQGRGVISPSTSYKPLMQLNEVGRDVQRHQLKVREGGKESSKSRIWLEVATKNVLQKDM